ADRENHRVQIFDGGGRYEAQWANLHRPCGLYMPQGKQPICYIGELGPGMPVNLRIPNLGPRLSIVTHEGKLLARLGALTAGLEPGRFIAPHGLAVDSRGDIYVGEVAYTAWPSIFADQPRPSPLRSLQKLVKEG
ncbi:MAG TPA: hypothetical protein VMU85_17580, partial [Stellaceae bacterium]|nr:hypothetical protein [Stellaceae bacterium]